MNKKGFLKALMVGLIIAVAALFVAGNVMAQVVKTQIMLQNGAAAGLDNTGDVVDVYNDGRGDVSTALVDNFEYWNNPRNMGWNVVEPPYPVWGAGLGYAQVNNVLDFEQGSRVFDVYRPMSVFLMNTQYDVLQCYKACVFSDGNTIDGNFSAMSVEVRAPLAIEQFDSFQMIVNVKATPSHGDDSGDSVDATIVFRAIEGPQGYCGIMNPSEDGDALEEDAVILVALGRMFQDGTWHLVMENLAEILNQYDRGTDEDADTVDTVLDSIEVILIRGNQYRLDNIMFTKPENSLAENNQVHLFHVGPVYCQLYGQQGANPQGRWVLCEDFDLGINAEYNEDGDMIFPNIFDPNVSTDAPFTINADGTVNGAYGVGAGLGTYQIDQDGNCVVGSPITPNVANITWTLNMGAAGTSPTINDTFTRVASIDGGDGTIDGEDVNSWPPYLFQEASDIPHTDSLEVYNMPETNPNMVEANETPYRMDLTNPMYAVACALFNNGYNVIPNVIRIVPHLGQVFEDMIVTLRASDGAHMDEEIFPVSVVNYPVTNHPPIINDLNDQYFYVGMNNTYRVTAYDPDIQDMGQLTWHATLNGLNTYQYGPWSNSIITPSGRNAGVISFFPQFEGAFDCIVTVQDPRGMYAVVEFVIYCINQGTWFNHPPFVVGDINTPVTIRAGECYIDNRFDFFDPDGDKLYYSCNVGSVGNNGVWFFQTHFPGYYYVQVTAYDIRGGSATWEFVVHVTPWWSL